MSEVVKTEMGIGRLPLYQVDQLSENQFQPWHWLQFEKSSRSGIELLFPGEDVEVKTITPPFQPVSDLYYSLTLHGLIAATKDLLILPHHSYYTDLTWKTPLPVACRWGTGWFPKPLTILFRHGQNPALFRKNMPFAQAIPVEDCEIKSLTAREIADKNALAAYIDNTYQPTRQDNLYNMLCHKQEAGVLDGRGRRLRLFHAQVVQTEKNAR